MSELVAKLPAVRDVGVSLPLRPHLAGRGLETLLEEIRVLLFLISLVRPDDCDDDKLRRILTNLLDTTSAGVQYLPLSLGSAHHRGFPRLSLPPAVAERIPSLHLVERGPVRGHVLRPAHTKLQWSVISPV